MLNKILAIMLIGLFIMPTALADEEYDPGLITPDSILWELDLRIERLQEHFAWNDAHRTALRIKHMNERLGEMQTGEKYDKVSARYMEQITRIETKTTRYESVEKVRNTFLDHQAVIMNLTAEQYGNETAIRDEVRNRIEAGTTEMEEEADGIIKDEEAWMVYVKSSYPVTATPTPVGNYGNFNKYAQFLDDGDTVIEIVTSNGTVVESYIIHKEELLPGAVETPITIQTGTTTEYIQKYTITVEQLKKYEVLV